MESNLLQLHLCIFCPTELVCVCSAFWIKTFTSCSLCSLRPYLSSNSRLLAPILDFPWPPLRQTVQHILSPLYLPEQAHLPYCSDLIPFFCRPSTMSRSSLVRFNT